MQVIHKHVLPLQSSSVIAIIEGAEILDIQMQGENIHIWEQHNIQTQKLVDRHFKVVGTGHPFDDTGLWYLGTVQQGSYVWHVFEQGL